MTAGSLSPLHEPNAQKALLLAEIGALLHNVGKVSQRFIAKQAGEPGAGNYDYQQIVGIVRLLVLHGSLGPAANDQRYAQRFRETWRDDFSAPGNAPINSQMLEPPARTALQRRMIELPHPLHRHTQALGDFIEFQHSRWYRAGKDQQEQPLPLRIEAFFQYPYAPWLLERSHHTASGSEKDTRGANVSLSQQTFTTASIASAFGTEETVTKDELALLRNDLLAKVVSAINAGTLADPKARHALRRESQRQLQRGVGDTQRPINDVTVWDLGATAAALFKAGAAQFILEGRELTDRMLRELKWRFMSVRVDGLAFLGQAHHITDLLGRQESLRRAFDQVRHELEVVYPLANEIYRDENGSVFVAPNIDGLLEWAVDGGLSLRNHLGGRFDKAGGFTLVAADNNDPRTRPLPHLAGEVAPVIDSIAPPQSPDDRLPNLGSVLSNPPPTLCPRPEAVLDWWEQGPADQLCTVCQLRPQGSGVPIEGRTKEQVSDVRDKATGRNVCYVCLDRRGRRSQGWATRELAESTIWMDEATDTNGRAALIVGRFDLDSWLDGTLLQTMTLGRDKTCHQLVPKAASFARLRRVWETTLGFWNEVQDNVLPSTVDRTGPRLRIHKLRDDGLDGALGAYHVYDLIVDGRRLSVVWNAQDKTFITADNLRYLAKLLNADPNTWREDNKAAKFIKDKLDGATLTLEDPGGHGTQAHPIGSLAVDSVSFVSVVQTPGCPPCTTYLPAIPLLAEPKIFMAVIPAEHALKLASSIEARYRQRMGRVQNRLRLDLGVIYFPRRTPLPSVLDAGRRLLEMPLRDERWKVRTVSRDGAGDHVITFDEGVRWTFPATLPNGTDFVADDWYPYFTKALPDQEKPLHTPELLVHVKCLRPGDEVWVRPSRFDFEFLESPARRLSLSYDKAGRRHAPERRHRPYWLDDLESLRSLWKLLPGFKDGRGEPDRTQIHQLIGLIETKRADWGFPFGLAADPGEETAFTQFVADALAQTGAGWWRAMEPEQRELLQRGARRGWLADVADLHLSIAPEPQPQRSNSSPTIEGGNE